MTERESRTNRARRLAREQALYRYSNALERGDFAAVAALLRQAEYDPALAQLIQEVNAALQGESEVLRPPAPLWRSTNGHARAAQQPRSNQVETQEQSEMAVNTTRFPRSAGVRRHGRVLPLTALAATLAVILFAGLLILGGSGGGAIVPGAAPGSDDSGAAPAGGVLQEATATTTPTFTITPSQVPAATATLRPDLVITATPIGGPQGEFNASPTIVPPDAFASVMPITATPFPAGGMGISAGSGLVQTIGTGTINGFLPDGSQVAAYLYVAPQGESLLVQFSNDGFMPWMHIAALDDAVTGAGIDPNQSDFDNPAILNLAEGERALILIGSRRASQGGSFTLWLESVQPLDLAPAEVQLDEENNEVSMTFTAPGAGFYSFLPHLVLDEASAEALSFGRLHLIIAQGEQWLVSADFNFPTETENEVPRHPVGITPGMAGDITITLRAEAPAGATFNMRFSGVVFGEGG